MFDLGLTKVSGRSIGEITFDAVSNEDHQSELAITENPVESGALIADHAVVKPKQVTITGVMVDHDHNAGIELPLVGNIRGATDFMNNFPLPVPVITQTAQTLAKAQRVFSQIQGTVSAVSDVLNQARALAPWLPDFVGMSGFGQFGSDSRVQKCYTDLLACQKSGERIEIQTGLHLYEDMLIQSVAVQQAQDGSATFTITAREIFVVETASSGAKKNSPQKTTPTGQNKSGRAGTQAAPKTQQGTTQPKQSGGSTALFAIFGGKG